MKYFYYPIALSLFFSLAACFEAGNKSDISSVNHSVKELTKNPSANITYEDGWAVVSKLEDGNKVYWFIAPDNGDVTSAIFKKIIYKSNNNNLDTKIVSECTASKQTCDDLMKHFKVMSEKYN